LGFYEAKNNTVHVIAGNHRSDSDVLATVYHEILGHRGFRGRFASRAIVILKAIYQTNAEVRKAADEYLAKTGKWEGDANRKAFAVEEVLAMASESGRFKATLWQRLVNLVRDFGRRIGFNVDYNNADVATILAMAHNYVIEGTGSKGTKVVGPDGKPLVVYHGTNAVFDTFKGRGPKKPIMTQIAKIMLSLFGGSIGSPEARRLRNKVSERGAIWFTADREVAEGYAKSKSAQGYEVIREVYLNLQRPLIFDVETGTVTMPDGSTKDYSGVFGGSRNWSTINPVMIPLAREGRADGLILKGINDGATYETATKRADIYIAFDPDQVVPVDEYNNPSGTIMERAARMDKLIDGLPSSLQNPVRTVTDTFGGFGARAISAVGLMNQLVSYAISKNIKSARRFSSVTRARDSIVADIQTPFLEWGEAHSRLPANERGTGDGTVSNLVMKMTMKEEWGFRPDYFDGKDKDAAAKVKMNPEFEAAYSRLSPAGQKSVRDIFKLTYGLLKTLQSTVVEGTVTEYDALIKGTKDADAKARLEADKANSLLQFRTLLEVDPTRPYASLRRNGDWVVVGRSAQLKEAETQDVKDYKLIRKLEEDADHYAVIFADTRLEAARIERDLEDMYGKGNTELFLKSKATEQLYGGPDMTYAFQRLDNLLESQGGDPKVVQQLRNAATQLQLVVMASSSARKAEIRRRNIYGGNIDMVQTSLSHARATAHFIGSISKNSEILESLQKMNAEVRVLDGGREDRQAIYNSIVARYVDGFQSRANDTIADKITPFTSVWMLGFAPSYYLQQSVQNLTITMPEVAKRYGYRATTEAFKTGYGQVSKAWEDSSLTESLDIGKVDPKYQAFATFLAESGALDVGIEREMGERTADSDGVASNAFGRAMDFIRGLTRKIEAINRLSAGVAVYDLAQSGARSAPIELDPKEYTDYVKDFNKAHPDMEEMTEPQYKAALEALDIINTTHGDYSMANKPPMLRGPIGRIIFQFQTFRVMLAGIYVRNFYNAFMNKDLSAEEKRIARRGLMFVSGHAAILGGLIGSPAAAIFILLYNMLSGDEEERGDLERDIREAVGNETIANLLLRGTPTLFGVDVSGTLGQGNLLSVSPYADLPSDRKTLETYVFSLLGPAVGGIGGNAADAIALTSDGNYYKALEKLVPRGIGAASRTIREGATGETTMRGDTLTQPIDINAVETFWGTIGLAPIARVNRQFARNTFYKDQRFYQERASDIKRTYVDASEDKDTARMDMLRLEWKALQNARRERGYKTQTMLDLVKAPREKAKREAQTVGGVPFTTGTKGRAEQIAELAGSTR
jgi:hypothetical protein